MKNFCFQNTKGTGLIELLVSVAIMGSVSALVFGSLFSTIQTSHDSEMIVAAEQRARTLRDLLAYELRGVGSGMPLGQSLFAIGQAGLGDAPLPVLLDSQDDQVVFRSNILGTGSVLTEDYEPGATELSFEVFSSEGLLPGDTIYISSMTTLGETALQGTIDSIVDNEVTIRDDYLASPGAIFSPGSTIHPVTTVTYNSPSNWSGITRDIGAGAVMLEPNSTFALEYLDQEGNVLPLPLTEAVVGNTLFGIRISVFVQTNRPLRRGNFYIAESEQSLTFRNLTLNI